MDRRTRPLLAVAALVAAGCSSPVPPPIGEDGRVVARDFRFTPDSLVIQVGQATSILFENEDKVTHSFRSSVLGGDGTVDVEPGASQRISFTLQDLPDDLTATFTCRFHGYEGMDGRIRIEP